MAYSLNRMWTAMAVSLAAMTSIVGAGYISNGDACCCPCPAVRPCVDPCGNFSFRADVLYWKTSGDGLAYAKESHFENDCCATNHATVYDVKNLHFDWNVGFRIGLGYDLPCDWDGWDVEFVWTHLQARTEESQDLEDGPNDGRYYSLWGRGDLLAPQNMGPNGTVGEVEAKWKVNFNMFDAVVGREFCCSPCLNLRPFLGLRAVWIDQTYSIHLTDENFEDFEDFRTRSEYEGIGLRFGLGTDWKIGCGLSLYGNASASVVYGQDKRKSRQADFNPPTNNIEEEFLERDTEQTCRAIADAEIGLQWKEYFWCDCACLVLQLGYEHIYIWDGCSLDNVFDDDTDSDYDGNPNFNRNNLCLHGLTFTARLCF